MVDDDGRTPDHGHPISSPCEPYGSGELKMVMVYRKCVISNVCFSKIFSPEFAPYFRMSVGMPCDYTTNCYLIC